MKGFTLMELLVVIVILGILAVAVTPKIMEKPQEARVLKTRMDIQNLEAALKMFKLDNGFYPSTEQGLMALIEKPETGRVPQNWQQDGYLEKGTVPVDAWGNPYRYISPGQINNDYDIISLGADGEPGGEKFDADIGNWPADVGKG